MRERSKLEVLAFVAAAALGACHHESGGATGGMAGGASTSSTTTGMGGASSTSSTTSGTGGASSTSSTTSGTGGASSGGAWNDVITGTSSNVVVGTVAVDAADNIVFGGEFMGTVDLGGGPVSSNVPAPDAVGFLVKLDAAGHHLWSKAFNSAQGAVEHVAVTPTGDVVVSGDFYGTLDLGGATVHNPGYPPPQGSSAQFVARYDAAGSLVWAKSFGDGVVALQDVDSAGPSLAPVVGGQIFGQGSIDLGSGPISCAGGGCGLLAKLAP